MAVQNRYEIDEIITSNYDEMKLFSLATLQMSNMKDQASML